MPKTVSLSQVGGWVFKEKLRSLGFLVHLFPSLLLPVSEAAYILDKVSLPFSYGQKMKNMMV
jgi:hypothetical protein